MGDRRARVHQALGQEGAVTGGSPGVLLAVDDQYWGSFKLDVTSWKGGMRCFETNALLSIGFSFGIGLPAVAATTPPDSPLARQEAEHLDRLPAVAPWGKAPIDHSGRNQRGHASYYSVKFAHRKMADGNHMNPQANVAASKNLPLGTTAKVINLQNGKSATVRVEDRGPFVAGRVMDVTFKVAQELGITKHGVVPVEVKPIAVPQQNGEVKLGAGAADLTPLEIRQATRTTQSLP